jgi:hypothetical protein
MRFVIEQIIYRYPDCANHTKLAVLAKLLYTNTYAVRHAIEHSNNITNQN